jgi:PAS domain S-box-containing protein
VTQEIADHVQALVYTSINDVIFHLRVEGDRYRFLTINPAFTRATGLSEDQVIGKFVDEIIPEPSLTLVLSKYREAIAERHTVRWEEVTTYPTGTKIGQCSITPVIETSGHCSMLVGTVCDITELRAQRDAIQIYADIANSVQIGLSVWSVSDPDDIQTIRLAAFNPAVAEMVEVDLAPSVGTKLLELLPAVRDTELPAMIAAVARDGRVRELETFGAFVRPSSVVKLKIFPLPGNLICVASEDVTFAHRTLQLQLGERRALELLAAGAPLSTVLSAIVETIEQFDPGTVGSILLVDETGTRLKHGTAPNLPEAYNQAIDGAPISAKAGSCGTAAFRGTAVFTENISTDPLWEDYRDLAKISGMTACWSTPILTDAGRVLGTFALYRREPGLPDKGLVDLIGRATHITAIVLERRRVEDELRALTQRIEDAREDERTGIAREIHDELGQALTAMKMDIKWLERRIREGELVAKLGEMTDMADQVIASTRRISSELRPGLLDDVGLAAAIEWQAGDFAARTNIACDVQCDLGAVKLERGLATAVFRIFQEALTNVVRHAAATKLDVKLDIEGSNVRLEVADDGVGLSDANGRRGLGIVGMEERARRLGGECTVTKREPRGTRVFVSLPIPTAT